MTWEQLGEKIKQMSNDARSMDVTIRVRGVDEYFAVMEEIHETGDKELDVLDPGTPYLTV